MGFLSEYEEVAKVDLGNGYWAELKVYLDSDSELAAQRALVSMRAVLDPATAEVKAEGNFDQGAYLIEMGAQSLIAWNLTDANDKPLPCGNIKEKRQSMGRLPRKILELFVSHIKAVPDREADFPGAAADGGEADGGSGEASPDSDGVSAS